MRAEYFGSSAVKNAVSIAGSFLILALITPSARAAGVAFEEDEEDYRVAREEIVKLILDVAGDKVEIIGGHWLKIPVAKEEYSEQAAKIARVLETRRVSLSFDRADVSQVFSFLQDVSGLNIVVSKKLVESAKNITIKVKDIRLLDAVNLICELAGGVSWTIRDEVLYIALSDEIAEKESDDFILIDLAEFLVSPPDFVGPDIKVFDPEQDY